MWNPLNYLGYGSSNNIPTQQSQLTNEQHSHQQLSIQKNTKLRQKHMLQQHSNYHKHIKQFEQLIMSKSHNQQQNNRLIKTFSQLILSLEQFLTVVTKIKGQYEGSLTKIQLFDSYQRKIENHDNIIKGLMQGHEREVDGILLKHQQQENILRTKLQVMEGQLQQKNRLLEQKQQMVGKLLQQNERLNKMNQQITKQLQQNNQKYTVINSQLALLNNNNTPTIRFQQKQYNLVNNNNNYININSTILNLKNILVVNNCGLAQKIFSYLDVKTLFILCQVNKDVNNAVMNKLPRLIYKHMLIQHRKQLQQIKTQSIYFNHILYDQLDSENTKINAIKYLFFNHKPGTYILSMFQQDITKLQQDQTLLLQINDSNNNGQQQQNGAIQNNISNTNDQQQQQKKSWRNFFKTNDKLKKYQQSIKTVEPIKSTSGNNNLSAMNNISQQQKFSLAELKNSQTFKKIEQQLSKSFHQHVFSLKLPKDLQLFGKIMTQQFLQLRKELSSFSGTNKGVNLTIRQWTSRLLTLSKFLYLQSQELWNLSQSIFSKLLQFQQQNHKLRSQIDDLTQNQSGMRKLVQQLARNKLQMQKRIWQSQRKSSFLKSSAENIQKVNEKLQQEIQSIRGSLAEQQTKSYQLQKQLSVCKGKLPSVYKRYKQKMDEFTQIKQQVAKISWM